MGCSCLKHPRPALIQRLRTATGMDFSGYVERGYTSVRPEYRSLGVGRRLLEGLTACAGQYKVFAVIDESNLATQKSPGGTAHGKSPPISVNRQTSRWASGCRCICARQKNKTVPIPNRSRKKISNEHRCSHYSWPGVPSQRTAGPGRPAQGHRLILINPYQLTCALKTRPRGFTAVASH